MMRRVILLAAVMACIHTLCLGQSSVNINHSGGSGSPTMVGPDQQPLANGNDVEIGYFDSGFNIQQNAGNESALMGAHSSGGVFVPVDFKYSSPAPAVVASLNAASVSFRADSQAGTMPATGANVVVVPDPVGTNQIIFRLIGQPGKRFVVESSSDLVNGRHWAMP